MPKMHKIMTKMRKDLDKFGEDFLRELKKLDRSMRRLLEEPRNASNLQSILETVENGANQLGLTAGQFLHRVSDRAASRGLQIRSLTSQFQSGVKQGSDLAKARLEELKRAKLDVAIKKAAKKVKKTRKSRKVKSARVKSS